MSKKYYAVKIGKVPGIYFNWDDCKAQVHGFKGAIYKSFDNISDAENFINSGSYTTVESADSECKSENDSSDEKSFGNDMDDFSLSEEECIAFVDGSYNISTCEYGYGMVIISKNGEEEFFGKGLNDKDAELRNVAGEILGSMKAIEYGINSGYKKIIIAFDYEGIRSWALGTWKTNKDATKRYKEFFDEHKTLIDIEFKKIKAHSKNKYNDMADRLAKKAVGVE